MRPAFCLSATRHMGLTMQFLVYLTVLMVSVSTVLLEIHWLTTPPPQPSLTVQASARAPRPMVEGPNAELSPVYPKKLEPVRPAQAQSNVQNTVGLAAAGNTAAGAETAQKPFAETTGAVTRSDDTGKTAAKLETVQKPVAETTGAATRADDPSKIKSAAASDSAHNAQAYAAQPNQNKRDETTTSNNRCDVQACGAYKSFRASDCTYQPFDGPRRVCGKAPEQRANREQREEPQRRSLSRREDSSEDSRNVDRKTRWRVYEEDDDDEADDIVMFGRSRRW